ncbi:AraC family transcriptional regulator [Paenibacillus abyssi]|uniref:Transcriptional regulator n=1 Tax=Paenibacillus abyssi TaxID=1340531 RepID=A0A917FWG3_9BACL|nr:AraC family transcriptional regulator [Paenibacillus abyssi]GGG08203.1 transcriptional regulator [Paenibacillus abyssi]
MKTTNDEQMISDLLQTLQLNVLEAHNTQCPLDWKELDYIPRYNKLYYILNGEGWIKVGNKEFKPAPGQLCLMPAYMLQSYSTLSNRPYLKDWCHFTATIGPFDLFQWIGVPVCIDIKDNGEMAGLFRQLITLRENSAFIARLREKAVLLEIISRYLDQVPVRMLQHRTEELNRLNIIQNYVDQHLHTSISVEEMAGTIHLHPNYFITYFRKHFGTSPLKYVNRKRVEKAKLLLTTTPLSIKEIADQTGFKETNHFTKFFRKETSYSPTEYRSAFA